MQIKFVNNKGVECELVSFEADNSRSALVRFECGNTKIFRINDLKNGSFSYPLSKNVFGVGFIGFGEYMAWDSIINKNTPEYKTWYSMLSRCYSGEKNSYTNVTVCEEWLNFQNFAKWYNEHYVTGWQIDKDLLQIGYTDKVYSPENCVFLPPIMNAALINFDRELTANKRHGKFIVRMSKFGKTHRLGAFDQHEQANKIYREEKIKYIKELCQIFKNELDKKAVLKIENM